MAALYAASCTITSAILAARICLAGMDGESYIMACLAILFAALTAAARVDAETYRIALSGDFNAARSYILARTPIYPNRLILDNISSLEQEEELR